MGVPKSPATIVVLVRCTWDDLPVAIIEDMNGDAAWTRARECARGITHDDIEQASRIIQVDATKPVCIWGVMFGRSDKPMEGRYLCDWRGGAGVCGGETGEDEE